MSARRHWPDLYTAAGTVSPMTALRYGLPDGTWHETEEGKRRREAEEARLAARTPAQARADEERKREDDARQLANWRQLYRAAGLKVDF